MLSKETNDIKDIIQTAKAERCEVIKTIETGKKKFTFITDAVDILIATEEDHIVIPLEIIAEVIESLKTSALKAIEDATNFTMTDKAVIAKQRNMTYGQYKSKLYRTEEYCKRTYI